MEVYASAPWRDTDCCTPWLLHTRQEFRDLHERHAEPGHPQLCSTVNPLQTLASCNCCRALGQFTAALLPVALESAAQVDCAAWLPIMG